MKYRREIDGLRAVAVVPVILFHAGFKGFSGGFVGVDVFFVISGYLITGIIHQEIEQGTFSIVRFYERRVRRILPALFTVCLACIPFAWFWMLPKEFEAFARSLIAVNLFSSNILFWRESGYFDAAAGLKPLLHTWSLAVEEQFYLFFPLLLLLFRKTSKTTLLAVLIVLTIASLGLAQWATRTHPPAAFFLLPTRAWELGIGAILAMTATTWRDMDSRLAQLGSITGIGLIAYATVAFDETVPFPGIWALVPVLGAALIIVGARPFTVVGKFLGFRPVVEIGLMSYSAYLWHQPLFAFARIRSLSAVPPATYLALSALALVLAYLSLHFIEQPFRRKSGFIKRQVFSYAVYSSVFIIAFGVAVDMGRGVPGRLPPEAVPLAAWANDQNPRQDECFVGGEIYKSPDKGCIYGSDKDPDIAIWGDSHAMALSYQLAEALAPKHEGLRQLTYSGCSPVVGYHRSDTTDRCPMHNAAVLNFLTSRKRPGTVILVARWSLLFEGERFDNREGGVEMGTPIYGLPLGKGANYISDPARIDEMGRLVRASIQALLASGKRVVLVYPEPEAGWDVPTYLAREVVYGIKRREPLSTSFDLFRERSRNAREQLDALPDNPNLVRIEPEKIFCNTYLAARCVAEVDGKSLYLDDDHFDSVGASLLARGVVQAMTARNWLAPQISELVSDSSIRQKKGASDLPKRP